MPNKMCRLSEDQLKIKKDFIFNYINAENAASGSTFDANANVTNKNVGTLFAEINKDINIQLKRAILSQFIENRWGSDIAEEYIKQLEEHLIYANDESAFCLPYCVAIDLYPFLEHGLKAFGGETKAPKHLSSYNGGFINLVFALSSQFAGAVAVPAYLFYFHYFAVKEYGHHYLERYDSEIAQAIQETVYAINQPCAARGFQSVFFNLSIFDKYYFESMFGKLTYPDGSKCNWEEFNELQKFFMRWFNEERTKALLTFPVVTVAMLNDGEKYLDEDMLEFISNELSEGNSFFIYTSDSIDSLSSCCFSKDTKVLWKSTTLGVQLTTLEDLHNLKWEPNKKNLRIFHNGFWIKGKTIKLPNRTMYKVTTANHKEYYITDNHINITYDGEKTTDKLTTNDYLMFNTVPLQKVTEADEHLTYEMGYAVGAFLGNGSFGSEVKGTIYETHYSMNKDNHSKCMALVNKANAQLGNDYTATLSSVYNNVYPVRISSKELVAFIQKWTHWEKGTYSYNKKLNLNCLLQSYDFRKGILEGWYDTDGGNSNRCYTTSKELAENMEVLITSLGMNSIIDISDRTDEEVVIRGQKYTRNYPLYCVRWYSLTNKRTQEGIYKWKNNSQYFRITSIEEVPYTDEVYCIECKNRDEPYFTLPGGLVTHNCRLRNGISDQLNDFSYSLGAGGIMTGSMNVLTLNVNRFVQESYNRWSATNTTTDWFSWIKEELKDQIYLMHKWQIAIKDYFKYLISKNMMPAYTGHFIDLDKQYLTIGLNGIVESAQFLGMEISNNEDYKHYVRDLLKTISDCNKETVNKYPELKLKMNSEAIPAESVGVKFAQWDKADRFDTFRDCYNSYFYIVEDDSISLTDKFILQGKELTEFLDGGAAAHINLEEYPTKETFKKLMLTAVKTGCFYYCFNIKVTICNECGYINKHTKTYCTKCHSMNIDYGTRIIGYLKRISSFSKNRQIEESKRYYHH